MAQAIVISRRCRISRCFRCLSIYNLCSCILAVLLLSKNRLLVSGSTISTSSAAPATTTGASIVPETVHHLDLSYLHRCGVRDIANTIRGQLNQLQSIGLKEGGTSDESATPDENTPDTTTTPDEAPTAADAILDIDLTQSLIGKNISEILSSLQRSEEPQGEDIRPDSSMMVRLSARRNQLSPRDITTVLEFLLQNGPTNMTTPTEAIDEDDKDGKMDHGTLAMGDKDNDPSPEISVVEVSKEETDNNVTAANAIVGAGADDDHATANLNTTQPKVNSDPDESDVQLDAGDVENEVAPPVEAEAIEPIAITRLRPAFVSIQSLDLSGNNLGGVGTVSNSRRSSSDIRTVNGAIRRLVADPERCPPTIRLEICGLNPPSCRELAKGIVERYQSHSSTNAGGEHPNLLLSSPPSLSLDLACNQGISDVGVAALAAAIRTVATEEDLSDNNKVTKGKKKRKRRRKKSSKQESVQEDDSAEIDEEQIGQKKIDLSEEQNNEDRETAGKNRKTKTIFDRLDLSGCDIGDTGAEALAIALTNNPLCVKHLDLSNNRITDQGAAALANALGAGQNSEENGSGGDGSATCFIETLDLSHNKDLGDGGAKKLALAFQKDGISKLILRSCNVRADGAACFGTALRTIGSRSFPRPSSIAEEQTLKRRLIDLSGNPLGILSKKKKSGSKYSASALKSKAKDTTMAYVNIIGKSLQKGLNGISGEGPDTLESDDEEEDRMGGELEEEDPSKKKCGALSLAEAFTRDGDDTQSKEAGSESSDAPVAVELGLRHCSFDTRAAEALAAVLQESREKYPGMKLSLDMVMNHVLEDSIVAALHGEEDYDEQLSDMAEVYLDALAVMREARQRAWRATQMAAARTKLAAERDATWGAVPPTESGFGDDYRGDWSNEEDEEEDDWDKPSEDDFYKTSDEDYSDVDDW